MIGTQSATNRKKHQPFKDKIRYAKAVTVCIALSCLEDGKPRIVLCSDTRLDYAELGSTNIACKLDVLGHGWCVQMAGQWSGVQEWVRLLKEIVQLAPGPVTASAMVENCKKSSDKFLGSPLYWSGYGYQLLVSGFNEAQPVIVKSTIFDQGEIKIESEREIGAIGEGESIALMLLRQREPIPGMRLSYGAYLAYEAKRASEKCGSVGSFTALAVQEPLKEDDAERAGVSVLNDKATFLLESVYRSLWSIPCAEIQELDASFFIDPTKKQDPE